MKKYIRVCWEFAFGANTAKFYSERGLSKRKLVNCTKRMGYREHSLSYATEEQECTGENLARTARRVKSKHALIIAVAACLCMGTQLSAIDASVSYAAFKSPAQSYVEVYLHIVGRTVSFIERDSQLQASVEVIMLIKQGEEIVKFDKYKLHSPLSRQRLNFIDLKRFALKEGDYQLEVSIQDMNEAENAKTYKAALAVDFGEQTLQQSDIQLLASFESTEASNPFVKNGYYMEPLPFNFYDRRAARLIFYHEVYNADKAIGDQFLVRYAIEKVAGNGQVQTVALGHKKREPKNVNVLLIQMDIAKLESGNYNLVVEIRNRESKLLSSKKIFFQRSNPYLKLEKLSEAPIEEEFVSQLDSAELAYSLRAIAMNVPDADVEVVNLMLAKGESEAQRRYLFSYWASYNPNSPAISYKKYMEVARAVDKEFYSAFGRGFETDRGWIFMKYGKPNDIVSVENEPSAPPYQIWVYNDLPRTRQRNVKFLFYNPSLANGNYQLLHSTARGEMTNPNWEADLYRDAPQDSTDPNSINAMDFNRRAREYFSDF